MAIRVKVLAAVVAIAAGVSFASVSSAGATTWVPTATRAMKLNKATRIGALPAGRRLTVAIGLRLRHASALRTFATAVNTPGSAQFHRYLTPSRFVAQYAPTAAQVSAVARYLRAQGLTQIVGTGNRLYITAQGTVGQIERAFHTSLARFSLSGRTFYANPTVAQVPASVAHTVLSVLGLNSLSTYTFPPKAKPLATAAATNCTLNPAAGSPYGLCYYTPRGFRRAYNAQPLTGSATSIGIMAEGNLSGVIKDLRRAEKAFGLPAVPITIVRVRGGSKDTSGADEWDLDTQYSTGMARTVKRLYLYDAASLSDRDIGLEFNRWVHDDVAKAASASFGECEVVPALDGLTASNDQAMLEAAAQGQTMHASSGDTGGQSCALAPTNGVPESGAPEVNYPCSSPYVVCVGGTSLFTQSNGSYSNELGWVDGGGGVSNFETAPRWQSCVASSSAIGARGVPDVAMDADESTGAEVYVNGTPEIIGGTSLSSPLALGAWAIMETSARNRLGFASPLLYRLYPSAGHCAAGFPLTPSAQLGTAAADPSYPLHDVYLGTNVAYPAMFGWDYVTGLGTYNVTKTARALDRVAAR